MAKNSAEPVFKQIKEDIVDDILCGVYNPGDMIPTQDEYAKRYGVSRLTVRRAMDDLIGKGILASERGRGTFVQEIATKTYSYRRLSGFSSNIVSSKVKVHSKVLEITEEAADKRVAMHLRISEGTMVIRIERLRFINEVCVSYQKSFLAKERVKGVDFVAEDLNRHSLYSVLEHRVNLKPSYVDEHFRAIRSPEKIAAYFKVEEGDPVLYVLRVTYGADNVPIEYCENYDSSDVNGVWIKSVSM